MRIRTVKPSLWRSMNIRELDFMGRLLFIGLLNYVDDNGVGDDSPALIAAEIFPEEMENDPAKTIAEVDERLWIMSENGLIHRFSQTFPEKNNKSLEKNRKFLEIVTFSAHQSIQKKTKGYGHPNYQPEHHLLRVREEKGNNFLEKNNKSLEKNIFFQKNLGTEEEEEEEVYKKSSEKRLCSAADFSTAVDNSHGESNPPSEPPPASETETSTTNSPPETPAQPTSQEPPEPPHDASGDGTGGDTGVSDASDTPTPPSAPTPDSPPSPPSAPSAASKPPLEAAPPPQPGTTSLLDSWQPNAKHKAQAHTYGLNWQRETSRLKQRQKALPKKKRATTTSELDALFEAILKKAQHTPPEPPDPTPEDRERSRAIIADIKTSLAAKKQPKTGALAS